MINKTFYLEKKKQGRSAWQNNSFFKKKSLETCKNKLRRHEKMPLKYWKSKSATASWALINLTDHQKLPKSFFTNIDYVIQHLEICM